MADVPRRRLIMKISALHIVVLLMFASSSAQQLIPTSDQVASAKSDIMQVILENAIGPGGIEFPFIAGFVRLSFHDCVGSENCDGCVDHKNPENKGLKRYTDALDAKYAEKGYGSIMSRADFYMLSAVVALEKATETIPEKFSTFFPGFLVGRKSCDTSPDENDAGEEFPRAIANTAETITFFEDKFGFTAIETIALLGAHTLGRANVKNSGFEGKWITGLQPPPPGGPGGPPPPPPPPPPRLRSDVLDNEYYREILRPWQQVQVAESGKWQFQNVGSEPNSENNRGPDQSPMFLNADISLAFDLSPMNSATGQVFCNVAGPGPQRCSPSPHFSQVSKYGGLNRFWMEDFAAVFAKMINKNPNSLVEPTSTSKDNAKSEAVNSDQVEAIVEEVMDELLAN